MFGRAINYRATQCRYTSYHEQLTDPSQNQVQAFRRRRF
ncbi:TPA_asm: hypothetical protein PROPHIFVLQ01-1_47 [Mycobacterium phage prophiFVLQ01-1]|nr:TPA_asm: hypothetical protein PROPHIFVLQ01-1_47 [Mycobacterium phage prophiFVLQ01-1]